MRRYSSRELFPWRDGSAICQVDSGIVNETRSSFSNVYPTRSQLHQGIFRKYLCRKFTCRRIICLRETTQKIVIFRLDSPKDSFLLFSVFFQAFRDSLSLRRKNKNGQNTVLLPSQKIAEYIFTKGKPNP